MLEIFTVSDVAAFQVILYLFDLTSLEKKVFILSLEDLVPILWSEALLFFCAYFFSKVN